MAIIRAEQLCKIYDKDMVPQVAVDRINLAFDAGEFTVIVGPSGSGKTTLLNLLGGLDDPTSGDVIVNGAVLNRLSSSEKIDFRLQNIGFVFQSYNLLPVLTARENVEFILQLRGWPRAERDQRVRELFDCIGLTDRMESRPHHLSGGQQQRVAVARALATRPKFVLADEPTANLDSRSAEALLEVMMQLNRKEETTFIFSTHDPRVMRKARRIITLEDGRVIKDEKFVGPEDRPL